VDIGLNRLVTASDRPFIARFDKDGAPLFATAFTNGTNFVSFDGFGIDRDGTVSIGGSFRERIETGAAILDVGRTNASGIFLARFDPNGQLVGANLIGRTFPAWNFEYGVRRFSISPSGNAYFFGKSTKSLEFVTNTVDAGDCERLFLIRTPLPQKLPAVATQPSDQNVFEGTAAAFQVAATGEGPLQFQWYRDGNAILAATNATLNIPFVDVADVGEYRAEVRNQHGFGWSSAARLTARPAIVFTDQPFYRLGPVRAFILGELDTNRVPPNLFRASTLSDKLIRCTVTGGTPPSPTNGVFDLTIGPDPRGAGFTIPQTSVLGAHSGTSLIDTSANGVARISLRSVLPPAWSAQLTLSLDGSFRLTPGAMQGHFTLQSITNSLTLFVSLTGLGPFYLQWQKNGQDITGATNESVTIPIVRVNQAGNYQCIASNGRVKQGSFSIIVLVFEGNTIPTAGALLSYEIRRDGLLLGWPAGYVLQSTDSLFAPAWNDVTNVAPYISPVSGVSRFFRTVLKPAR
jgi:hypothetical protein